MPPFILEEATSGIGIEPHARWETCQRVVPDRMAPSSPNPHHFCRSLRNNVFFTDHDILADLGYPTEWEDPAIRQELLYEGQPEVEAMYEWRDSRVLGESTKRCEVNGHFLSVYSTARLMVEDWPGGMRCHESPFRRRGLHEFESSHLLSASTHACRRAATLIQTSVIGTGKLPRDRFFSRFPSLDNEPLLILGQTLLCISNFH